MNRRRPDRGGVTHSHRYLGCVQSWLPRDTPVVDVTILGRSQRKNLQE